MLRKYFSLTRNERLGFFVCVCIVLLMVTYIHLMSKQSPAHSTSLSTFEDSVRVHYAHEVEMKVPTQAFSKPFRSSSYPNVNKPKVYSPKKPKASEIARPPIDINSATYSDLITISGIGDFYAKQIVEMRQRYGGFVRASQLLDIYGMTDEKFERIRPYISVDTSLVLDRVELNSADSLSLSALYGLTPSDVSNIIKYRDRLGGFYEMSQFPEVYGIGKQDLESLKWRTSIDTSLVIFLDVNNITFKQMIRHPYIGGYENTKAIFRFLDYGGISDWEEFLSIPNLEIKQKHLLHKYIVFKPRASANE